MSQDLFPLKNLNDKWCCSGNSCVCVCVCAKCTYISPQDRCLKVELLDQRTYFWNVIGGASKSLCPLTLVSGSAFSLTFLPIMQNWMCLLFYCVFYYWWNLFFIYSLVLFPLWSLCCPLFHSVVFIFLYIYNILGYIWDFSHLFNIRIVYSLVCFMGLLFMGSPTIKLS